MTTGQLWLAFKGDKGKGQHCPGLNVRMNMPCTPASAATEAVAVHVITTARFAASANNHLPEGVWWTYNTRGVG